MPGNSVLAILEPTLETIRSGGHEAGVEISELCDTCIVICQCCGEERCSRALRFACENAGTSELHRPNGIQASAAPAPSQSTAVNNMNTEGDRSWHALPPRTMFTVYW